MSAAIRFEILGNYGLELVIGEQFAIDGSEEVFAVHRATYFERRDLGFEWSATHTQTGLRIAKGNDIDTVITDARSVWASKTPEELQAALAKGRAARAQAFAALLTEEDLCNE